MVSRRRSHLQRNRIQDQLVNVLLMQADRRVCWLSSEVNLFKFLRYVRVLVFLDRGASGACDFLLVRAALRASAASLSARSLLHFAYLGLMLIRSV